MTTNTVTPSESFVPQPLAKSLLKIARPKQWVKNVLVLAAPAAAGVLTHADIISDALITLGAFLLVSVGTYFVNDAIDYEADRLHPKKRFRPVAAGHISPSVAWAFGIAFLILGLAVGFVLLNRDTGFLLSGYVAMTLSYGLWLKHVPIVELACVASGFVLRMIAGGLGTDVLISQWFLTVASFSSLFVVAGKRYSEVRVMGEGNHESRAVLKVYTAGFLRASWTMAMTVSIAAYMQWAFETADIAKNGIWYQVSAVPWVIALLRYALILDSGEGGAPEEVFAKDRTIQVFGAIWLLIFAIGVYAK